MRLPFNLMAATPTPEGPLLREIQDALVNAFYDPDPVDPTPEVDYAVVDWVAVITDARAQLDKYKSMASGPAIGTQPEPLVGSGGPNSCRCNEYETCAVCLSRHVAASQPPAVPVQDALTTLVKALVRRCRGCETNGPSCSDVWPSKPTQWCAGCLALELEAALRREPPAVSGLTRMAEKMREEAHELFSDAASWRDVADKGGPFDPKITQNERRSAELNEWADEIERTSTAVDDAVARLTADGKWFSKDQLDNMDSNIMSMHNEITDLQAEVTRLREELKSMKKACVKCGSVTWGWRDHIDCNMCHPRSQAGQKS